MFGSLVIAARWKAAKKILTYEQLMSAGGPFLCMQTVMGGADIGGTHSQHWSVVDSHGIFFF